MTDSTPSTGSTDTASVSTPSVDTSAPSSGSSQPDSSASAPSWEDALSAAGLTGGPDPDAPEPAPSTPALATVEPVAEPVAPVVATPDPKGPIPFERHEAILTNARRKAAEEFAGQVKEQFGPAIQLQQRMQTDPVGTLTQLIDEAVAHPEIGQHVVSQLARTLSARRKTALDLTPIDTEVGPVYTAQQVQSLVDQQIQQRIAPIEQDRQARAQEAAAAQAQQAMRQTVVSNLKAFEARPGFTEHKAEIAAKQQEYVAQGMNTWTALSAAYFDVYDAKELPKLQAQTTNKFVQDATRKALASTGNPASVAPSTGRRPATWEDALAQQGL